MLVISPRKALNTPPQMSSKAVTLMVSFSACEAAAPAPAPPASPTASSFSVTTSSLLTMRARSSMPTILAGNKARTLSIETER